MHGIFIISSTLDIGMAFRRTVKLYRSVRLPEGTRLFNNATGSGDGFTIAELKKLQAEIKKLRSQLHLPNTEATPKRTIAVTVGPTSTPLKVVNKYSHLYTNLGIPCLCVAPRVIHVWSSKVAKSVVNNLLKVLDTNLSGQYSLILHLLSGATTVLLPTLSEEHASRSPLLQTKFPPACVVFDSSPVDFTYENTVASTKHMHNIGGFNWLIYWMVYSVGIVTEKLIGTRKRYELRQSLDSTLLDIPQLFLYSEADTVSLSPYVEGIIAEQRSKGRNVTSFRWKDSLHVRHLVTHPEEYKEQVTAFLKECNLV